MEERVKKLEDIIKLLMSSTTIPQNIDGAFRKRFNLDDVSRVKKSSKGATTENKTVNEAGTDTYSVLKSPDGFLEVNINGVTYYIPYYV